MIGWSPNFNWTYDEFNNVVTTALEFEKRESICLDVEHSDRKNMDDIMNWAKAKGYKAVEVNCDTIRVMKV